jgi:hypothetical protein
VETAGAAPPPVLRGADTPEIIEQFVEERRVDFGHRGRVVSPVAACGVGLPSRCIAMASRCA